MLCLRLACLPPRLPLSLFSPRPAACLPQGCRCPACSKLPLPFLTPTTPSPAPARYLAPALASRYFFLFAQFARLRLACLSPWLLLSLLSPRPLPCL